MEKKDREALLQFRKEEAEKSCVHKMAAMCFRFMIQSPFARNMAAVPSIFPLPTVHYANRNSGFHYVPPASTPLRTPHPEMFSPR